MAKFNTHLEVRLMGKQLFSLKSQLVYENDKYIIKIYEGFQFDGASIPKPLWSIYGCPFGGLYTLASCLHDAMYSTHLLNKSDSDELFLEAMLASGVNEYLANQLYIGVSTFGYKAYNEKENIADSREYVEIILKGMNDEN